MNHQTAMRETRAPSTCTGEVAKGNSFYSQDFRWVEGTCKQCGMTLALLDGFSHRFNYVIEWPTSDYQAGYQQKG